MEATQKAQQELEQIERQVALIEATAGQNERDSPPALEAA